MFFEYFSGMYLPFLDFQYIYILAQLGRFLKEIYIYKKPQL